MQISDFNILYLNLNRRPERLQNIENILSNFNSPIQFKINAIDGQLFTQKDLKKYRFHTHPLSKYLSHKLGKLGCYLSHLEALRYAVEHNFDNVLILEDDIDLYFDISMSFKIPPHADLIYFGGLVDKIILEQKQFIKIVKPMRVYCTFSYAIIGKEKIKEIYNIVLNSKPEAIDLLYIHNIQSKRNSYILSTPLFIPNFKFQSDVTNIETNRATYNTIKKYIYNK